MSNRLISMTGAVCRCSPRRVKRRWARPAVMVLLVALLLWLMSGGVFGVESASPLVMDLESQEDAAGALAWDCWLQGLVMGFGAASLIVLCWCAALKVKRDDEAAQAEWEQDQPKGERGAQP